MRMRRKEDEIDYWHHDCDDVEGFEDTDETADHDPDTRCMIPMVRML